MTQAQNKSRQSVTTTASFASGEGGIFPRTFSQVVAIARNATQTEISQATALLWLLAVVGGCLGVLGIVFSTVSAHSKAAPIDIFHPVTTVPRGRTMASD